MVKEIKYISQHCCDETMDRKMALFGYIANAGLWIVQIMMNEVTFVGFKGGERPPGSAPAGRMEV